MSKKQQPSRSEYSNHNDVNLHRLENLGKEFSEYLSILELLDNIDRPRNSRLLSKFDLHRLTGKEHFVVADNKVGSRKRG
jgi:hypothetical protein